MEKINLLQPSPRSPDMVPSPAQWLLSSHPVLLRRVVQPCTGSRANNKGSTDQETFTSFGRADGTGDGKDTACPGKTRSQPTSPPSCAKASSQRVPLLSPQVQAGLAHRQVHSCRGQSGCCQLSQALLLEEMPQAGTAAPASADGEGAQDAAALKREKEQRKKMQNWPTG